jgi:hypothetical protein
MWVSGKKIVSNWTNTLYDLVHSTEAKEYWCKKDVLPMDTIDTVHWEAIHLAMTESKRSRRVFVSKHTSGMCGVGKFMERWKLRQSSACPMCGEHKDAPHIWKCKGVGMREIWEKALSLLERWMNSIHTDPDIQHAIIGHLRSWWDDAPNQPADKFFD